MKFKYMFLIAEIIIFFVAADHAVTALARSNAISYTTWYLAEGCTTGFETWVLVQNPNTTAANVTLTFMKEDGTTATHSDTVAANSRRTFKVNDYVPSGDVSTKVESTNNVGIIVERAMYWYDPTGTYWQGGHDANGVTSTSRTWYLAEGCTSGFETWVLVQNPNTTAANVTLTFMKEDGTTAIYSDTVAANSRRTFRVNDYVPSGDVSTKVESTNNVGIIAERVMYWYDPTGTYWQGGHASCGVTAAATTWYLAEGCTSGFETWVLVQNPNTTAANVTLTFMKGNGTTATHSDTVAANSRRTFKVNDYVPSGDVSTKVESTNNVGIIAERVMYWYDPTGSYWQGGHASCGVTAAATTWYLAEGCTSGFETWVLVQNPNTTAANITLTFMKGDGTTATYLDTVAANSRRTFKVNDYVPSGDVSTKVESTNNVGIIAERAMYWYDPTGSYRQEGHCSAAVRQYAAAGPDPDYENFTWTLPAGASSLRLSLPADINDFLLDSNGSIGGFGLHAGGHFEGLDHVWIELKPGTPVKSWADGVITDVILTGSGAGAEYHIYINYGNNLSGIHMEVETPYVAKGDTVTRGQEIAIGKSFVTVSSAEMSLIDLGRDDGPSEEGGGVHVSPFDYLTDADKRTLVDAYNTNVIEPYVNHGTEAWGFEPYQPYLTNQLYLHDGNSGKLTGEWYLTSSDWAAGYPSDVMTFIEAINPSFYSYNVILAQDNNQPESDWDINGTFEVNYSAGQVRMVDTGSGTIYYGIFEINESGDRATLRIEYQEGSYPANFSSNAPSYIERN